MFFVVFTIIRDARSLHAQSANALAPKIMPQTPHIEKHFTAGEFVRDAVIGMSDGLTVPFALAAGLSGAVSASKLIVTAGLAEVAAGSIAMGLGGFLAARGDVLHFEAERAREEEEIIEKPEAERAEVQEVFETFGLSAFQAAQVTESLSQNPEKWVDFMMRFELGMEKPDPSRAWKSALTIAGAYIAGGFVPLAPYFFVADSNRALPPSIVLTLLALAVFGGAKGRFTGTGAFKSALQTVFVGGLAAAAAFSIARAIGGGA